MSSTETSPSVARDHDSIGRDFDEWISILEDVENCHAKRSIFVEDSVARREESRKIREGIEQFLAVGDALLVKLRGNLIITKFLVFSFPIAGSAMSLLLIHLLFTE